MKPSLKHKKKTSPVNTFSHANGFMIGPVGASYISVRKCFMTGGLCSDVSFTICLKKSNLILMKSNNVPLSQ